jgi:D-glycero-D-manno-heptose 1,7-bisphosphate phosphatase
VPERIHPERLAQETHPAVRERAVLLDRDGVLIRDVDLLTDPSDVELLAGVPTALVRLRLAGFALLMVTNQTVVARGLASLDEVRHLNADIMQRIIDAGGPELDGVYVCPHHPHANLPEYRVACDCRKPRPGMLRAAAAERGLDLGASFVVGDRMTDVAAGAAAGCRTVLVHSGRHCDAPIVTVDAPSAGLRPDHECAGLEEAARWIAASPGQHSAART